MLMVEAKKEERPVESYEGVGNVGYGFFLEALKTIKDSALIERAFQQVFGRKPTLSEKYHIASAYEENKKIWGIRLRNPKFVKWIQQAINRSLGKNVVAVDGIFGYQTVVGIMAAQKALGLKPTGVLDQVTFEKFKDIMGAAAITTGEGAFFEKKRTQNFWLWVVVGGIVLAGAVYLVTRNKE